MNRTISIGLATVVLLGSAAVCTGCHSRPGAVVDAAEARGASFDLRIVRRGETVPGPGGGWYYEFQSRRHDGGDWRTVVTVQHDDLVDAPVDRIRFVSDRLGYFSMCWTYAVTTDGGQQWSVWDARSDLSGWECCNYGLIRDVAICDDGTGTMNLDPIPGRRGEVPILITRDFGVHWTTPPPN